MSDRRLAEVVQMLRDGGADVLVLGGHAVRHYGVDRSTIDYDFVTAAFEPVASALRGAVEGPSWRPSEFRRFVIGTLPDGRDERAEFWLRNHLLAPFDRLSGASEEALVEGTRIPFIALDDLIRSKETEREDDWRDVSLLEEIADERRLAAGAPDTLSRLRSRRGFQRAFSGALFEGEGLTGALDRVDHPISAAFLAPFGDATGRLSPGPIADLVAGPLRRVSVGDLRHLALVEAVRRLHRAACMEADRRDKARFLPT